MLSTSGSGYLAAKGVICGGGATDLARSVAVLWALLLWCSGELWFDFLPALG